MRFKEALLIFFPSAYIFFRVLLDFIRLLIAFLIERSLDQKKDNITLLSVLAFCIYFSTLVWFFSLAIETAMPLLEEVYSPSTASLVAAISLAVGYEVTRFLTLRRRGTRDLSRKNPVFLVLLQIIVFLPGSVIGFLLAIVFSYWIFK
jgi:hypothetical protein